MEREDVCGHDSKVQKSAAVLITTLYTEFYQSLLVLFVIFALLDISNILHIYL